MPPPLTPLFVAPAPPQAVPPRPNRGQFPTRRPHPGDGWELLAEAVIARTIRDLTTGGRIQRQMAAAAVLDGDLDRWCDWLNDGAGSEAVEYGLQCLAEIVARRAGRECAE